MSILRLIAERYLSASNNCHIKSLKRKMHRAEAAAESLRERYEAEVDKGDMLRDRMEAVERPEIGKPGGYRGTGDAYQDQVRSTAAAIVAAGRKARGLPPCEMIDRYI